MTSNVEWLTQHIKEAEQSVHELHMQVYSNDSIRSVEDHVLLVSQMTFATGRLQGLVEGWEVMTGRDWK